MSNTIDLLLTGEPVDGRRALAIGVAGKPGFDARVTGCACEAARHVASGAPLAARWHKTFIDHACGAKPLPAEERYEGALYSATADFKEGRRAMREQGPACFRGH